MNHFNLSFLEIFFISFYKFHPSLAEVPVPVAFENSSDEGFSNLLFGE